MAARMPRARLSLFILGLTAGIVGFTTASLAEDCGDIKKITEKRQAEMSKVGAMVAAAKGKPIDPTVYCKVSQPFIAADNALIAFMEKNKDWCGIPDEAIANVKSNHVKSVGFTNKACSVAAQWKKQQEAGGGNGAPQAQPLPTGPL
jgi:hypothetical protein